MIDLARGVELVRAYRADTMRRAVSATDSTSRIRALHDKRPHVFSVSELDAYIAEERALYGAVLALDAVIERLTPDPTD